MNTDKKSKREPAHGSDQLWAGSWNEERIASRRILYSRSSVFICVHMWLIPSSWVAPHLYGFHADRILGRVLRSEVTSRMQPDRSRVRCSRPAAGLAVRDLVGVASKRRPPGCGRAPARPPLAPQPLSPHRGPSRPRGLTNHRAVPLPLQSRRRTCSLPPPARGHAEALASGPPRTLPRVPRSTAGDGLLPAPRGVSSRREPENGNRTPSGQFVRPKRLKWSASSPRILCLASSVWRLPSRSPAVNYHQTPPGLHEPKRIAEIRGLYD